MPKHVKMNETEVNFEKVRVFADKLQKLFKDAEKKLTYAEMADFVGYTGALSIPNFLVSINNHAIDVTPVGPDLEHRQDECVLDILKDFQILVAKEINRVVPIGLFPVFLSQRQMQILNNGLEASKASMPDPSSKIIN